VLIALALLFADVSALAATVHPDVRSFMDEAARADRLPVIVRLGDREDLAQHRTGTRRARRRRLVRALRDRANRGQAPIRRLLRRAGYDGSKSIWSINAIAVEAGPRMLRRLSTHPAVDRIDLDEVVTLQSGASGAPSAPVEWNIDMVRADQVWSLGFEGDGVVIGVIDSGVDVSHPELAAAWRGGSNSWDDLVDNLPTPHDTGGGHGTQVAGLLVGGPVAGTHIGVAPSAQWIGVRAFDGAGNGLFSDLHLALQWMLDPDGNSLTDDAPDVVNNSWGVNSSAGTCLTEFHADVDLLRAAGIGVVFSAGNTGPGASTDVSPGNDPDTFAVGAVDAAGQVPLFTANGPSACDSSLFPNVSAPGVSVYTTDRLLLPPGYTTVSGTSFAAPHVSASMALLWEAFPSATLVELENVLEMTATDVALLGPDNYTGHGVVNARAALGLLVDTHGCPVGSYAVDTDTDGFADACDTCTATANSMQRDTDSDGFGNMCDGDFNQDLITNFGDLGAFASFFGTTDPDGDLNGDGAVNFGDLGVFITLFGLPPGPSGYDY